METCAASHAAIRDARPDTDTDFLRYAERSIRICAGTHDQAQVLVLRTNPRPRRPPAAHAAESPSDDSFKTRAKPRFGLLPRNRAIGIGPMLREFEFAFSNLLVGQQRHIPDRNT